MSKPVRYFLYYIEGLKNAREAKEQAIKVVGPSIEGATLTIRDCAGGPGKTGPGIIVAALPKYATPGPSEVDKRTDFCADPAKQTWIQGNGFWVGYNNDLKPSADDLQRESQVNGYRYTCPISGNWIVPLARKFDGTTMLDQRIAYLPDGTITKKPIARFEELSNFASEHWEKLTGLEPDEDGIEFEADQRYCDIACKALGVNYHVGPYELTLLETLTMQSAVYICGYLCDWPGLIAILEAKANASKKNNTTEDSSTMNSGDVEK